MSELLPCPFCGSNGEISKGEGISETLYIVGCSQCDCVLDVFYRSELEAVVAWNRRTPTELEAQLKNAIHFADTRQQINEILSRDIAKLEAQLAAEQEKAGHYYQETAAIVAETCAENERLKAQLAQTWQPLPDGAVIETTYGERVEIMAGSLINIIDGDDCHGHELPINIRLCRLVTQEQTQTTTTQENSSASPS